MANIICSLIVATITLSHNSNINIDRCDILMCLVIYHPQLNALATCDFYSRWTLNDLIEFGWVIVGTL